MYGMRGSFLIVTVKELLKSAKRNCRYAKIKLAVFFGLQCIYDAKWMLDVILIRNTCGHAGWTF